jgi:hypothetical protein
MKEILKNMEKINNLEQENKTIDEQIKTQGIEIVNTLLYSLNSRLSIYGPILRRMNMGINISLKQYDTKYDGYKQVHIVYSYSDNNWKLLFNNIKIKLDKGIDTLFKYQEFCIQNPIIQELDFETICSNIENYITNVQETNIRNLTEEIINKQNSLKSFKDFVDNNLMITLNTLFKIKNDFKDTGNLDLIESIITAIDAIEDYIAEDLD